MGHKLVECPFKKHIDELANMLGERAVWGAVKHTAYFGQILNNDPGLAQRLAADHQARMGGQVQRVIVSKKWK